MNNIIEEIESLYLNYGSQSYEEKCTQLQHAQQCGTLALEQGFDDELVLAAFLHDIGHFVAQRDKAAGFTDFGHPAHDDIGAEFLAKNGFSERIVMLVKEHVKVKRYLAAIQPGYLEQLSHASTVTLTQQGGAMTAKEVESYRKMPFLEDIITLRRLDDSGKMPQMACKPLDYWLEQIAERLNL
ncbi:HD domain-containing protein [Thalassomonas viridans]|uniref:HD domain-containing protein n=1 Tax=Thalassomonas viridans TaxID=137584 RepID=A0AAF0CD57_9GAMM|nr:HD domain-containing protein [Thalassomonas viridans]WDE08521.1 HD domain-containing protein [Thalassomonas viridans]